MPRTELAELDRRIERVVSMLIEGASTAEILHYAAGKRGWHVAPRTVRTYIAKARERVRDEWKRAHADRIAERSAQLRTIYSRALKTRPPQYNAARRALDSLIRLEGLEPPRTLRVSASVAGDVTVHVKRAPTMEERAEVIRDLVGLAAQRAAAAASKRTASDN